jgi:hypothetical protein
LAMALCAAAALVLSLLHLKEWKAQRVDPGIEREFNKVFMTTSKEGKQAPIKLIGIGRNATGRKRSDW